MCDLHDHDQADEPVTINSFVDELVSLPGADQARIMGGNLAHVMRVD